jgi:hypothetical protein
MPPSKSPFACRTFNRTLGAREGHSFRVARLRSAKKNKLFRSSGCGLDLQLQNDPDGHAQEKERASREFVKVQLRQRTIDDGVFDLELDLDDAQIISDHDDDAIDNIDFFERSSCLTDDPIEAAERDEASQWDDDEFEDDGSEFSKRIDESNVRDVDETSKTKTGKKRRSSYGDRPPTTKGSAGQQTRFKREDTLLSDRYVLGGVARLPFDTPHSSLMSYCANLRCARQ